MATLPERFLKACEDFSLREAMRVKTPTGWHIYRYKDFREASLKVAWWLKSQGFKKDDKAAIILENSPYWGIVYFGVLLVGGVVVPLDPHSTPHDISVFLKDSHTDFVFMENKLTEACAQHLEGIKIVLCEVDRRKRNYDFLEEILVQYCSVDLQSFPAVSPKDTASIIYTSGTTSYPKGIELSHENFLSNWTSIDGLKICNAEDNFISILPLFHAYAFMATLILPLLIGARITYPRTIKSTELVPMMKETNVSMLVGVPELFANIYKSITEKIKLLAIWQRLILRGLMAMGWFLRKKTNINILKYVYHSLHERFGESLRYFVSGGARLDPEVAENLSQFGFTILEGYGLTETSPIVTLNPPDKIKIGSVGRPIPEVEVKIVQADAEGIGEIIIRGPNVMKGYFEKPEETQKVIKEGWFYSGDLGFMDREGYLYVTGRLKEGIVLSSGKNIYPEEIEKYYAHSRYIKDIGVFFSEEERALKALVTPNFDEFKKTGGLNIMDKIKWDIENISKGIPSYKRIMGFTVIKEELPKTRLGKIKRYQLDNIYKKEVSKFDMKAPLDVSAKSSQVLQTPTGKQVVEFLKKELAFKREINATDHLELDLGIDSLTRVELLAGFERMFQIRLSDHQLTDIATVEDLIKKINYIIFHSAPLESTEESPKLTWQNILKDVSGEEFERSGLSFETAHKFTKYLTKVFLGFVFKIFFRLKIIDRIHLPPKGPFIICANHTSYLDAFVVASVLPYRVSLETYFIGLKEIFDLPVFRWSVQFAQVIPIDPSIELIKAMQMAAHALKHDKILCIFPEGQRSIDGEVKTFKKGLGILAKELDVKILPAAICGTHEAWPRTAKFPRPHPVKIIFGKPINVQEILKGKSPKTHEESYAVITETMQKEVTELQRKLKNEGRFRKKEKSLP